MADPGILSACQQLPKKLLIDGIGALMHLVFRQQLNKLTRSSHIASILAITTGK